MAHRPARHRLRRSDLWSLAMISGGLICAVPLYAQVLGWRDGSGAQRAAASALLTGMLLALFAADTLRGQRRRVVLRRRLPDSVIVFLGLSVALGIVAALIGAVVLLGILPALPIDDLLLQLAISLCFVVVLGARGWAGPERFVL